MLKITCNQCHKSVLSEDGTDPDSLLSCSCCKLDHHHGQAANSCAGIEAGHAGQPCPAPDTCTVLTPQGQPCPGDHCGPGVPGCTVCRPITIVLS